jgi:hypothetical protein
MVPFSEADSDRFFGRDIEVQELLERLRLHPFVTVIGPSGSGPWQNEEMRAAIDRRGSESGGRRLPFPGGADSALACTVDG